jgi:hypothetical protein
VQIILPQTSKRIQIKHTHTQPLTLKLLPQSTSLSLTQITKALQLRAEGGKEQASCSRAGRRKKKHQASKQRSKQPAQPAAKQKKTKQNKNRQKISQKNQSIMQLASWLAGVAVGQNSKN